MASFPPTLDLNNTFAFSGFSPVNKSIGIAGVIAFIAGVTLIAVASAAYLGQLPSVGSNGIIAMYVLGAACVFIGPSLYILAMFRHRKSLASQAVSIQKDQAPKAEKKTWDKRVFEAKCKLNNTHQYAILPQPIIDFYGRSKMLNTFIFLEPIPGNATQTKFRLIENCNEQESVQAISKLQAGGYTEEITC